MKTQITEKMLEHIVYKSAIRLIQESLRGQMNFGTKGNIPLEPSSTLCNDVNPQVLDMVDSGKGVFQEIN